MINKKNILILDNSKKDYTILAHMLGDIYTCTHVTTDKKFPEIINKTSPICILLNYESFDFPNKDLLKYLKAHGILSSVSLVLLSDQYNYKIPKECEKYNISYYIPKKDITQTELIRTIKNAIEKKNSRKKILELNNKLTNYSRTDKLTGLMNRSSLIEKIQEECLRVNRDIEIVTAAIIDIDFFSAINDTYSYTIGDKILKEIAKIIKKTVRKTDIVSRYGDDEFIIIFINRSDSKMTAEDKHDINNLGDVCKKIQKITAEYDFNLEDFSKKCTLYLSIGLTQLHGYLNYNDLLKHADCALNYAKTHGKGNTAIYEDTDSIYLYDTQ
jgi:diguanylate cyclase (GGDEF)-like protein